MATRRGRADEPMEEELPRLNELQQKELNMLVEGLGGWDEDTCPEPVYIKHPDALEYVKDLQRCLRREDPQMRIITLQLGRWRFVSRHLLPLLISCSTTGEQDLASAIVKLLVTLTMPLPRTVGERVRNEHLSWMQEAKEGFAHKHVMVAIMTFLAEPLMDRHEEHNNNLIELVLTLFRNLLLIPDGNPSPTASSTDYRAHLHDRLVLLFHSEDVFSLLMLVGQTMDSSSRGWNLLVLEILHLLLRWETPQSIWGHYMKAHTTAMRADLVGEDERDGDEAEDEEAEEERRQAVVRKMSQLTTASRLQEQFRLEKQQKSIMQAASPTRHSRFGGTYCRITKDGRQRVLNKSVHEVTNSVLGRIIEKKKRGIARSHGIQLKKIKKTATRHSSLEGLMALKTFVGDFLDKGCYNKLLEAVGEDIEARVERLQSYDEINFVWMVSFFTGFQRLRNSHREQLSDSASTGAGAAAGSPLPAPSDDLYDDGEDILAAMTGKKPSVADPDAYDAANIDDDKGPDAENAKEGDHIDGMDVAAATADAPPTRRLKADPTKAQRLLLLGPVAAGIEFDVFHFVARKLNDYVHDKQWEQTEVALRAVKEIVLWVNWMREEPLTVVAGNALLSNIIYNQEHFLSVFVQVLKIYNAAKAPLSLLRDAVEALMVLLSMTEDYAKRYNGRVYVRAPSHRAASTRGGSDEEEDEEGEEKKTSRADDTGADDVLQLGRLIGNIANNAIITNCLLLLKYHRLNPAGVNRSVVALLKRLAIDNGDEYRALFYRLAIVKQLHDVLAEPEFLYAQALRSHSRTLYAAGGLEGLDQVAQAIVSGIAKLAATDPFHYIYLLFQKPRADVTFQSLALAQTHPDDSGDEEERRSAAVGPRKARKAKKAASTREDGTRQWNDAEDQVLRELMSTFDDLPIDKLFQFLSNGLPGIRELDIGRRLVALGLLAEESFASKFPVASSAQREGKDANSLADVFGGSDSDSDDAHDEPDAGSAAKRRDQQKQKQQDKAAVVHQSTKTPTKMRTSGASTPSRKPKPAPRRSAAKPAKDFSSDDDDDENDENDWNAHNIASAARGNKRSLSSLCSSEDIEEEVLMMKLNNLADDSEGLPALQWLKAQMQKCVRERKKAEKNDDVLAGFVLRASERGKRNEFLFLELKWLGRVMSELGFRYKEKKGVVPYWKIPSALSARSLENRIAILDAAQDSITAERKQQAAVVPSRRDLLATLKRKRRERNNVDDSKDEDEDAAKSDSERDGSDDKQRDAVVSPAKRRKLLRRSNVAPAAQGDLLSSELEEAILDDLL